MSDDLIPANTNKSFSQIMGNKQRKLTEDALGPTLYLLDKAGVPPDMIGEVLFTYLKSFARPGKDAPDSADIVWFAQLQRFRDDLNTQIAAIENALSNEHD